MILCWGTPSKLKQEEDEYDNGCVINLKMCVDTPRFRFDSPLKYFKIKCNSYILSVFEFYH